MKNLNLLLIAISFLLQLPTFAQVSVDHPIELTGSGANAKLTGIQSVTNAQDATSAAAVQNGMLIYAADQGTANAYAVTLSPAATAYTAGMIVNFIAANANTGASTINVNNLGTITIKKQVSNDLAANDILANMAVSVIYDGTNFQMLSQLGNSSAAVSHGKQTFTSSGTFTVPSGVTTVWVSMCGGGGGGGYSGFGGGAAGGGGAQCYLAQQLTLSQSSYSITVGAGGTSPASPVANNGGSSSFGSLLTANGGNGANTTGAGASGGAGGSAGNSMTFSNNSGLGGGMGGGTIFGTGGPGGDPYGNNPYMGGNGSGYGSGGGGGAVVGGGTFYKGGTGANGLVLVEW